MIFLKYVEELYVLILEFGFDGLVLKKKIRYNLEIYFVLLILLRFSLNFKF